MHGKTDNMQLNIELLQPSELLQHSEVHVEGDKVNQEIERLMQELKSDPLLARFFTDTHTTPVESCITPTITGTPEEIVDGIVAELEQDPDLCHVFDDMELGLEIDIPETSPLEDELAQ